MHNWRPPKSQVRTLCLKFTDSARFTMAGCSTNLSGFWLRIVYLDLLGISHKHHRSSWAGWNIQQQPHACRLRQAWSTQRMAFPKSYLHVQSTPRRYLVLRTYQLYVSDHYFVLLSLYSACYHLFFSDKLRPIKLLAGKSSWLIYYGLHAKCDFHWVNPSNSLSSNTVIPQTPLHWV